jgi:HNH endonuclease
MTGGLRSGYETGPVTRSEDHSAARSGRRELYRRRRQPVAGKRHERERESVRALAHHGRMGKRSRQVREQRVARERAAEQARVAAKERREAVLRGAEEGRQRGCLFCRKSDGGFSSVEHIVPESLGNREAVLPVGVVCDRCNQGVLSRLDAALCDFGPIAMMKTLNCVPSKAGKLPSYKFDNGQMHMKAPGELVLQLDSAKWRRDIPGRPASFSFTTQRHDNSKKRLSLVHRALVKQVVEYAWRDLGPERLLSSEFDHERDIVLNGRHHGYLIFPKAGQPTDRTITMHYQSFTRTSDAHPVVCLFAGFWGVYLATDTLFPEPQGEVPEDVPASILTF